MNNDIATVDTADTFANTADVSDTTIETPEVHLRVLKMGATSSLSNRSTLGYAIGCDGANAIYVSLQSNTAAGMFSKNWVAFAEMADLLLHADKITSSTLLPLYEGTSRNNAGFMLAVLLGEGLAGVSTDKDRSYQRLDAKPFLDRIHALLESGVDLGDADVEAAVAAEAIETAAIERPAAKRGRPRKT
jgi:hypothetical protein